MAYVEGFVIPVPEGRKDAYAAFSALAAAVFRDHGATRVVECWGDDLPPGRITDFQRAVQAGDGDGIVFSWIEWPSKAARDEGGGKVMADPRMKLEGEMPFDGKRMIHGGFAVLFDSAGEA